MRYRTEILGKMHPDDRAHSLILESDYEIAKGTKIAFNGFALSTKDTDIGEGYSPNSQDLTAEQARDMGKRSLCKGIFIEIKKATLEGDSSIRTHLTLKEENHLNYLGYKVTLTCFGSLDPFLYEISWEN